MTAPEPCSAEPPALAAAASHAECSGALAVHIQHAGAAERAALARLQPGAWQAHRLAALALALGAAGIAPEQWHGPTWPRWALIAHGMALVGHDGTRPLGFQLEQAGVSASRVNTLLNARGTALMQLLPRILRLLASKGVAPNWCELGELLLLEASSERSTQAKAEQIRLRIAGPYFSALAHRASKA